MPVPLKTPLAVLFDGAGGDRLERLPAVIDRCDRLGCSSQRMACLQTAPTNTAHSCSCILVLVVRHSSGLCSVHVLEVITIARLVIAMSMAATHIRDLEVSADRHYFECSQYSIRRPGHDCANQKLAVVP